MVDRNQIYSNVEFDFPKGSHIHLSDKIISYFMSKRHMISLFNGEFRTTNQQKLSNFYHLFAPNMYYLPHEFCNVSYYKNAILKNPACFATAMHSLMRTDPTIESHLTFLKDVTEIPNFTLKDFKVDVLETRSDLKEDVIVEFNKKLLSPMFIDKFLEKDILNIEYIPITLLSYYFEKSIKQYHLTREDFYKIWLKNPENSLVHVDEKDKTIELEEIAYQANHQNYPYLSIASREKYHLDALEKDCNIFSYIPTHLKTKSLYLMLSQHHGKKIKNILFFAPEEFKDDEFCRFVIDNNPDELFFLNKNSALRKELSVLSRSKSLLKTYYENDLKEIFDEIKKYNIITNPSHEIPLEPKKDFP